MSGEISRELESDNVEKDKNEIIKDLYREKWNEKNREKISFENNKKFWTRVFLEFLKQALGGIKTPDQKQKGTQNIIDTIQKNEIFTFNLEGQEEIGDSDIVFANHQGGTKIDGTRGDSMETVFIHYFAPNARIVLKNDLVSNEGSLKEKAMAKALRNMNPIVLDRPEDMKSRVGVTQILKEIKRTTSEVCKCIEEDGKSGFLYPEGERSQTGEILDLKKGFFEVILNEYIIPRAKRGDDVKIGILVSDTLQAFPEGMSPSSQIYDKPVTMRGIKYDPTELIEKMKEANENLEFEDKELMKFVKFFKEEVEEKMKDELIDILDPKKNKNKKNVL